jgi:flagellar biosynthetic protein FliQ
MDITYVTDICHDAVAVALLVSAPALAVAVTVGLLISILQAVTQIQDQTVSIVPKLRTSSVGRFSSPRSDTSTSTCWLSSGLPG